jgi:hypothetical protein
MTKDDVLFRYPLQLFAEAARTNVSDRQRPAGVLLRPSEPLAARD